MKHHSMQIILALGSNIGSRYENLLRAQTELHKCFGEPVSTSKIYESIPVDYLSQPSFLNMVILYEVHEKITPGEVLKITQGIEIQLGRKKEIPKGPRNIDIDILFINDKVVCSERLQIPHPEISYRDFVIYPLQEIRSSAKKMTIPKPSPNRPNRLRLFDIVSNNCLDN